MLHHCRAVGAGGPGAIDLAPHMLADYVTLSQTILLLASPPLLDFRPSYGPALSWAESRKLHQLPDFCHKESREEWVIYILTDDLHTDSVTQSLIFAF